MTIKTQYVEELYSEGNIEAKPKNRKLYYKAIV
jgi:hypothetical protein